MEFRASDWAEDVSVRSHQYVHALSRYEIVEGARRVSLDGREKIVKD